VATSANPPLFSKLPRVLAVALAVSAIIVGAFSAQYYAWTLMQPIYPLVEEVAIPLATSGATHSQGYRLLAAAWVKIVQAGSFKLEAAIPMDTAELLLRAFAELKLRVEVGEFEVVWVVVHEGNVFIHHQASFSLLPGMYTAEVEAYYVTRPVDSLICGSFEIRIWLVEAFEVR